MSMPAPIVLLAGPHGSGKSGLGSRACAALGLRFLDLASLPLPEQRARLEAWARRKEDEPPADVVALPVELQAQTGALRLARRVGVLLGLWAHPLEMQARSGRAEPLFTPARGLTTHGGFGREGTRCPEFRRLDRACDSLLFLRGLSLEEAVRELRDALREERRTPLQREGDPDGWATAWREDYEADPRAAKLLARTMSDHLDHLRAQGASPRTLTGIESDLDAAASLVFAYHAPKGKRVLDHFQDVPCELEYGRRFSDSPAAMERYRRSLEGLARFLQVAQVVERASR